METADKQNIQLLIDHCKADRPEAQRALYQVFAAKMFAICLRYAKDRMSAEDVLQSGFVKIFRHIKTFKQQGSLEGWMRKIMVNTAIEHYRKAAKMHRVVEIPEDMKEAVQHNILDELQLRDLLLLISKLPDGYRLVFNMYVIEGFSHKEIAGKLGITEGGSKSQLSRAREILRVALKKREEVVYAK